MKKFIFDVDGTLTPSRQMINLEFLFFFTDFVQKKKVYLVTGSDRKKTLDQITPGIYNKCRRVYNCSGSDVYEGDKNVYRDDWEPSKELERFLNDELAYSCFPIRNGVHIEKRYGGINFSILGRGDDPSIGRDEYIRWDLERMERHDIADRIRLNFPELTVALGGQTGLDIGPKGSDKSQILRDFRLGDEIVFFGDRMEPGGNDYSLGEAVKEMGGKAYSVTDWTETRTILLGIHQRQIDDILVK